MNKAQRMANAIQRHGEALLIIFPNASIKIPSMLCRKLRLIEHRAHWIAEDYCNGVATKAETKNGPDISSEDFIEHWTAKIKADLIKVLGQTNVPIKINWDPRGYALKIDDQYVRNQKLEIYRDWGGYGIIAPDLSEGF